VFLQAGKGFSMNSEVNRAATAAKNIFVDIPVDHYNSLLGKCEPWRGELDILKNAVITHDPDGQGTAQFLCKPMQAELLRDLAVHIHPLAAVYNEDSIKGARTP
jgi:hypothetical protein